ncbi:MAG: bifunctional ADP-dependent NAD(P)H-hydrate dehydratase/NAD(P)H-hydrate epimerase [Anaerolineae bacterium]
MFIVTTRQMQAAEKAADAAGLSYRQMMENAGRVVAQAILSEFDVVGKPVVILVGPGNNGGDGLVVARHLSQAGARVAVYIWKRNLDDDLNWTLLDDTGVERLFSHDDADFGLLAHRLAQAVVLVDALLGTGVSRPIGGTLANLLRQTADSVSVRAAPAPPLLVEPAWPVAAEVSPLAVVAVDLPSGLNSDSGRADEFTLPADLTVTLAAAKRGHLLHDGPRVTGRLQVGDIGITADCYPAENPPQLVTGVEVAALLPHRAVTAHKGTFGTALLVAGCKNYVGAAVLATTAAARAGTGLVTLAAPHTIYPIVATRIAEATYLPLRETDGYLAPAAAQQVIAHCQRATALLVGPGLGNTVSTGGFLKALLMDGADQLPPLLLDADALNILAAVSEWWQLVPPNSILTPHPGEMARLMGVTVAQVQADRLVSAASMAARWGQIVVLKGAHTVIASPGGQVMVLPFANPALAKGGSGDVLAGLIIALRAQGLPPFEAAISGAYLHGLAGEHAAAQLGAAAVLAGDLVSLVPVAIEQLSALVRSNA